MRYEAVVIEFSEQAASADRNELGRDAEEDPVNAAYANTSGRFEKHQQAH